MKYMVISDIHGCVEYTNKAIEIFKKEEADFGLLLFIVKKIAEKRKIPLYKR